MNKNIKRVLLILVLFIFTLLYFFGSNIFPGTLTIKRDLTLKEIEKFEKDVKAGVEVDINDYIVKDKNYDNIITKTNKKISNIISSGFKKLFKYLLKNIDI